MTPICSFRAPLCAAVLALAAGTAGAAYGHASAAESDRSVLGCGGDAYLSIDALRGSELEWTLGTSVYDSVQVASPWLEGTARCDGGRMVVSLVEVAAVGDNGGSRGGGGDSVRVDVALHLSYEGSAMTEQVGGRTYNIRTALKG